MQTYFVIGAGGTGTHLMAALLAYLRNHHANNGQPYQVVVADGDSFTRDNTTRQLFNEGYVATNKAEAMVHMYPGHPLIAISRYLGDADIRTMIQSGDVVLICADNYSIRALVADHVSNLDNAVVINAGNENHDGSVQLWVRRDGNNITPPITYGHPEIRFLAEDDRAAMTCAQVAALPGGGQTLLANMAAATYMLNALYRWHNDSYGPTATQHTSRTWTELQFDLANGTVDAIDMRTRRNWHVNPARITA